MSTDDIGQLQRRLDTLTRAAARLRTHVADLHGLGWEKAVTDVENVASGKPESKPPGGGDPRARRLFARIVAEVASSEAELVGLDRQMLALFTARSERPDPTRGSTISVAEHDRLLAAQRDRRARGESVPARIELQPQHPGKRR